MITLKLIVNQLDKSRFFKGKTNTYCDLVLTELRVPDDFGNTHIVTQSMTKEEREQNKVLPKDKKKRMPIVGNAKAFKFEEKESKPQNQSKPQETPSASRQADDEIPF